jgi:hypothetical protein
MKIVFPVRIMDCFLSVGQRPTASTRFDANAAVLMNHPVQYDALNPFRLQEYCTEQFNTS